MGNKKIVNHILDKLERTNKIDEVFIVTNQRFYGQFVNWTTNLDHSFPVKIINDETLSNEDRLGAVGDLNFFLNKEQINDNLLVIAGDNLFGFSLNEFLDFYQQKQTSVVAFKDLKNLNKVKGKYGVGILDNHQVIDFAEKPLNPKSALASTACYVFTKNDMVLINELVELGKVDNPGDLVKFLSHKSKVHGFVFTEHWFDVGSFSSLEKAKKHYSHLK